jgi:hypothetical protein
VRQKWQRLKERAFENYDEAQVWVNEPAMLQISLSEETETLEILQKQRAASLNL